MQDKKRESKEDKLIKHGSEVIKELYKVYDEGIATDEYSKLLKEYKRLYKRYEKTIKLSDSMGNGIMEQNDSLSDSLQYTIKTARSKLMDNVTEHRKTKEVSSKYLERSKKIEEALELSYKEQSTMQKKLKYYIRNYGEIKHSFSEEVGQTKKDIPLQINAAEYKNMNIKQVLSLELSKDDRENFFLARIKLNNFDKMIEVIEQNSSLNNFILGTYKYIKNCFSKNDIIFHLNREEFYIIVKNRTHMNVKESMMKLNQKRKVLNFPIIFSIGMTKFKDSLDNAEILLKRCDKAFEEAVNSKNNIIDK